MAFAVGFWFLEAFLQAWLGKGGGFLQQVLHPSGASLASRIGASLLVATGAFLVARMERTRDRRCARIQAELRQANLGWNLTYQFIGLLDASGRLLTANQSSLNFIGATLDSLRGRFFVDCPWWSHDPLMQERLVEAIGKASRGEVDQFEACHIDHEGELHQIDFRIRPVLDADGNVEFLVPEGHDITELRKAEQEQARLSQMLRMVLDNTPTRVFWKDLYSRYLGCNIAFARDAGLDSPSELLGLSDHDLVWKDQADQFRNDDRLAMESGTGRLGIEEPQTRPDGSISWLRTSKIPLRDVNGNVIGVLGTYEDVTKARQDQIELDAQRRNLQEANRELERRVRDRTNDLEQMNRELQTFAHSAAHDLRTPLRAIDGWSYTILDECTTLDDESKAKLARIRGAAQRIGETLDDLLRLSEASRKDFSPQDIDLSQTTKAQRDMLQALFPHRDIEWIIPERMPFRGDPDLLRLMIWNLLENAVKYTSGHDPARIEVGTDERGLFVRDNGIGFDMAHSAKLFKAFQRLHPPEEFTGTGIGLAIVHRIAERHGGRMEAEGVPGGGATFRFVASAA